jgi:hypothetical protein
VNLAVAENIDQQRFNPAVDAKGSSFVPGTALAHR